MGSKSLLEEHGKPRIGVGKSPISSFPIALGHARFDAAHRRLAQYDGDLLFFDQLARSPYRTWDPNKAQIFVVPAALSLSHRAQYCNGTSHEQRMATLVRTLQRSEHFIWRNGRLELALVIEGWQG